MIELVNTKVPVKMDLSEICTASDTNLSTDLFTIQKLFDQACSEVEPFDWVNWSTLGAFKKDPSIIENLTKTDLLKITLAFLRAERFCEGTISAAIENGVLLNIAKRIESLQ